MSVVRVRPLPIYAKQAAFRGSNEWMRGFVGGRGSGKTRIGAVDTALRARDREPWMGVSPDSSVIEETTLPTFVDVAKQLGVLVKFRRSPYPKVWFRTQDGGKAEIVFRSGEKPEKLRGPSKAGLWIDEASVVTYDVLKIGIAVLRHNGRMGKCTMTFTPKGRKHWTFTEFFASYDPDHDRLIEPDRVYEWNGQKYVLKPKRFLVHATSAENPFLPIEYVENIQSSYSAVFARQELGGEFVDIDGLMFARENFRVVGSHEVPRNCLRVRYWDRAGTEGAGSYTSGCLMARCIETGIFYIENIVRGQWSPLKRNAIMEQTAKVDAARYGNEVIIYAEQEGGSAGKEVSEQTVRMLAGFPVYRDIVSGKRYRSDENQRLPGEAKIIRAMPLSAAVEGHQVCMVEGAWNREFLEEIIAFPESTIMDQVDSTSGAFNKLSNRATLAGVGAADHRKKPLQSAAATVLDKIGELRMRGKKKE